MSWNTIVAVNVFVTLPMRALIRLGMTDTRRGRVLLAPTETNTITLFAPGGISRNTRPTGGGALRFCSVLADADVTITPMQTSRAERGATGFS
jgi:hypothetical protein